MGSSWSQIWLCWGHVGAMLAHFGPMLGHFSAMLEHFGVMLGLLGPMFGLLAPMLGHFGAMLGHCKVICRYFGVMLEPSWCQEGSDGQTLKNQWFFEVFSVAGGEGWGHCKIKISTKNHGKTFGFLIFLDFGLSVAPRRYHKWYL